MEELNFTWQTGLKLFVGLLILAIWYMAKQEAHLDQEEGRQQEIARNKGEEVPRGRILSKSSLKMAAIAIVVIIIVLFFGNKVTI